MNIPYEILEKIRGWTDIAEFPGYQVSRLGEVRSLDRWITHKNGQVRFYEGQRIKSYPDQDGYRILHIAHRTVMIHRLVAQTFIPNPYNLPQVNHLSEVKSENFVWNLCWCTAKENANWGTRNERQSAILKGRYLLANKTSEEMQVIREKRIKSMKGKNAKKVLCISTGEIFDSVRDAELKYNPNHKWSTNISACCRGEQKTAYGMEWTYI